MKDSTSRKPTVSDVARRAGVSVGSVSRVLTGKNWVSDGLRKQVLEAASELNYIPNSVAQSLKTQRTMTVGAIVSDMATQCSLRVRPAAWHQASTFQYGLGIGLIPPTGTSKK